MNARSKLNVAYLGGALIVAACVGVATLSWAAFAIAAALGVAAGLHGGGIRPNPNPGRRRR